MSGFTQDDELGFALDPHSGAGPGRHLHAVLHPHLQPPQHHRTDGRVHALIDVKAGFVGQTPDLTKTRQGGERKGGRPGPLLSFGEAVRC